jgi:hypothetical protein
MPAPRDPARAEREQTLFWTCDSLEKSAICLVIKPHGPIDEELVT